MIQIKYRNTYMEKKNTLLSPITPGNEKRN